MRVLQVEYAGAFGARFRLQIRKSHDAELAARWQARHPSRVSAQLFVGYSLLGVSAGPVAPARVTGDGFRSHSTLCSPAARNRTKELDFQAALIVPACRVRVSLYDKPRNHGHKWVEIDLRAALQARGSRARLGVGLCTSRRGAKVDSR